VRGRTARPAREQIGRLEHELGGRQLAARSRTASRCARAGARPRSPARACSASASSSACATSSRTGSPRSTARTARPELLEDMYRAPERHRWEIVTSEQLGEPDCRRWHGANRASA
jgi:hypothetical protein